MFLLTETFQEGDGFCLTLFRNNPEETGDHENNMVAQYGLSGCASEFSDDTHVHQFPDGSFEAQTLRLWLDRFEDGVHFIEDQEWQRSLQNVTRQIETGEWWEREVGLDERTGAAFARDQYDILLELGLSDQLARAVIASAGPARAVYLTEWVLDQLVRHRYDIQRRQTDMRLLSLIQCGSRMSVDEMVSFLESWELKPLRAENSGQLINMLIAARKITREKIFVGEFRPHKIKNPSQYLV